MKTFPHAIQILVLALGLNAVVVRAEETAKPDEGQLRAAADKGLAFLDKGADTWMNERTCTGCHHMPELVWSHREAQRRGFAVDQKMFDEFVDWSYSRAKSGPTEMVALLTLAMPAKATTEMADAILKSQKPDGSWNPAGQFTGQKRGTPDARANATRLAMLALSRPGIAPGTADAACAKAADFLAKSEPATCIDSLMCRVLYAQRFGPAEEISVNRAKILKLQHPDGGWSFMIGEEKCDPIATGEALYILRQTLEAADSAALARGEAWLVGHQRGDGGWDIDLTRISTNPRSSPEKAKSLKDATMIYTFWGSAWATMGLVEHFPVTESKVAAAP